MCRQVANPSSTYEELSQQLASRPEVQVSVLVFAKVEQDVCVSAHLNCKKRLQVDYQP